MNSLAAVQDVLIRFIVAPYLCDRPKFIRWKRTHKKARIAKKWKKRYGGVYTNCKGVFLTMFGKQYLCPHAMRQLTK